MQGRLEDQVTEKVDVYSFGVCLWEIWMLGEQIHPDLSLPDIFNGAIQGHAVPRTARMLPSRLVCHSLAENFCTPNTCNWWAKWHMNLGLGGADLTGGHSMCRAALMNDCCSYQPADRMSFSDIAKDLEVVLADFTAAEAEVHDSTL